MKNSPNEIPEKSISNESEAEMNVAEVHGSILRERDDPQDGYEPIPLWLVTFIMVVVFWSGMYLSYNSGDFNPLVFDPAAARLAAAGPPKQDGPPDPMVVGKRIFSQNCVVCHQATGLGVPGQFPPLAGSEWVLSQDWHGDNHLVKIILHGLQGPIKVKGNDYNNAMPAQKLDDAQIAAVLTYIRNEWGNSAPPISEAFVARIRTETAGRTEPMTQSVLQSFERVMDEAAAGDAPATEPPPAAPETPAAPATPEAPAPAS